ncbi:MAG: IS5 family transposase [Acetobacter orientalis]
MVDDRQHCRACASACGWCETRQRGADAQALGRSRGGLSTKIHIATDGLGNPVRMLFTLGQRADVTQGEALIDGIAADIVIADKGHDADRLVETIEKTGAEAVIPPKRNRRVRRDYDRALYKERNLVERFINKIKHFRRVATRYDKLIANYRGFVTLAAIVILMR